MLQNDFFTFSTPQILETSVLTTLKLNAAHKIFLGHFPQHPIVPGVCMMQMLKEVMEHVLVKKITLLSATNIKFLTIIDPRITPNIQLKYTFTLQENSKIIVDAQLLNSTTIFFKFKGTFGY